MIHQKVNSKNKMIQLFGENKAWFGRMSLDVLRKPQCKNDAYY